MMGVHLHLSDRLCKCSIHKISFHLSRMERKICIIYQLFEQSEALSIFFQENVNLYKRALKGLPGSQRGITFQVPLLQVKVARP